MRLSVAYYFGYERWHRIIFNPYRFKFVARARSIQGISIRNCNKKALKACIGPTNNLTFFSLVSATRKILIVKNLRVNSNQFRNFCDRWMYEV